TWTHLELEHLPSYYVTQNCMFTFGDDKIAMLAPEYDSVFMWACDWPHLDAVENWTAPKGEFSPRTRWVNAAELYGIKYDKYL
ncbi:MAG TPA: hypothetical protein VM487_02280, partial [Phycisphaerae bacterium]|nr:hypothetical protein [Phycisphaerae bacterium]